MITNVLDFVEKRVDETMWSFAELDSLTPTQYESIKELVSSACNDTSKAFKCAQITKGDES